MIDVFDFLGGWDGKVVQIRSCTGCRGHKIHFQMVWVKTDEYNILAHKLVSHNASFTCVGVHSENPLLILKEAK